MILDQGILVTLNALLYLLAFVYYLNKVKSVNIGVFLLFLWASSAIVSVYFYYTNIRTYSNITIWPYIYLFTLVFISFIPILKYRSDKTSKIKADRKLLDVIAIIICLISFLPTVENLIMLLRTFQGNASFYISDVYNAQSEGINYVAKGINQEMSWLGRKLNLVNLLLMGFTPLLLFYQLSVAKKKWILVIGLLLAVLNPFFHAYAHSSRVFIVVNGLYLVFVYLLFKNVIDSATKTIIRLCGGAVIASIIFLSIIMTIYRYENSVEKSSFASYSIIDWTSLYIGEGMLNFNNDMWNIREYMEGDNSFALFKYLVGSDTFLDNLDRRLHWQPRTGIDGGIFYTYIGDYYGDLGGIGTIVFIVIIITILLKTIKYKNTIEFHKLILLSLWYKICMMGFTYYTFKVSTQSIQILISLSIYFAFTLYNKSKLNSKIKISYYPAELLINNGKSQKQ